MPAVAFVTIWWTAGFSFLLFLAGLRAIPVEIYEAAALDNAGRWTTFRKVTWPLLWPITALVVTIQLILQLKIFDQVYLFSIGGRPNDTLVMVQYIFTRAFVNDQGGRAAAIAVTLFVIVIVVSALQFQLLRMAGGEPRQMTYAGAQRWNLIGGAITVLTVFIAVIWAFPLYWGVISSLKPEDEVIRPYIEFWPDTLTFEHYYFALTQTMIGRWYFNSLVSAIGVTIITISMSILCGYALSQLQFPGRKALYWLILASFMVPTQTLIINHFVLIANMGLLNTWAGIILPQLIHPVIIIVYKQFFDSVPKDFREAAVMDNASEFSILFKIFVPMNWGVTTALSIIVFIWTWNAFLWPFLAVTKTEMMTVTVGITQVNDSFGVFYAKQLAAAVLAGFPVALAYLIFQRRVTQAITLSAGIKG